MGWVKLEDRYPRHPKMLLAGEAGLALDVCGMCYAREHGTNGFVPSGALTTLGPIRNPKKAVQALMRAGRWSWDEDIGGWWIHDFELFNPTDEEDRAAANERRERARKAARARWSKDATSNAQASGEQCSDGAASTDASMPPSSSPPSPTSSSSTTSEVAACSEDDEQFIDQVWPLLARRKLQLQRDAGKTVGNEVGWLAKVAVTEREARMGEAVSLHRDYPTLGTNDLARVLAGERSILRTAPRAEGT